MLIFYLKSSRTRGWTLKRQGKPKYRDHQEFSLSKYDISQYFPKRPSCAITMMQRSRTAVARCFASASYYPRRRIKERPLFPPVLVQVEATP